MKWKAGLGKKENTVWAVGFCVLLFVALSLCFDFYYDLNDDVLMKDILAGVYTGVPEGHNIQMLYPISLFISLFYRVGRGLPWYGIFLCVCQFGSICIVTKGILDFAESRWKKLLFLCAETVLLITLLLWEFVFVQYTVTCMLLAAAAAFRFYLSDSHASCKDFVKHNIPSILLVVLAFQIRSEMLLLMLPLICVTGLCKWTAEKPVFTGKNAAKYFSVFGAILAGLALSQGVHMLAYGSEPWQHFNSFFDSRTQLYDFLGVPSYTENADFYESIGLTESEQELFVNYNFGLDEEIDDALLKKICDYAEEQYGKNTDFMGTLKKTVVYYKYRTLHEDAPFSVCVIAAYLLVLAAALLNRHYRFLWELPLMGFVRTGLWLYILYRGRAPIRITHSLYLMEFTILLAMFLSECSMIKKKQVRLVAEVICLAAVAAVFAGSGRAGVVSVKAEYDRREEVNRELEAFRQYTEAHPDNFYFWDVYSSVAYSQKMFAGVNNQTDNYDIMGGWASKSPLMYKKYALFGMENMESALTENGNVYMVESAHRTDSLTPTHEWLPAYYAGHGVDVKLVETDRIMDGEKAAFVVYRIEKQ